MGITIPLNDPEISKDFTVNTVVVQDSPNSLLLITYFSDWKKLKVEGAWFLKVKEIFLNLSQKRKELQASDENIPSAHLQWRMRKVRSALDDGTH